MLSFESSLPHTLVSLRTIFDNIDIGVIESYVENGQEENASIEFKTINRDDLRHPDDKKNLAVALSGFMNSSGGIIVWGVRASKNADGIDCANELRPIDNLGLFVARLNEMTGASVMPISDGVIHKPIHQGGGSGYVITLVSESESGPHMAMLGDGRYYKRSGDSFYRMEHYDIEDMFGRRKKPRLKLIARPTRLTRLHRPYKELLILLSIFNEGRGSAKSPFLAVELPSRGGLYEFGVDGNGNLGLPQIRRYDTTGQYVYFGSTQDVVIHPGIAHDVTQIRVPAPRDYSEIEDIRFSYRLSAEDVSTIDEIFLLSENDIMGFYNQM